MHDIDNASAEELLDIKKWYFYENIRITQEKQKLENYKKELEKEKSHFASEMSVKKKQLKLKENHLEWQKELFDKKWAVLQKELERLARDWDKLREDKIRLEEERKAHRRVQSQTQAVLGDITDIFFQGVDNKEALRKRYKDLNKIYHPDNLNGDTKIIQEINKSYNIRKRQYNM